MDSRVLGKCGVRTSIVGLGAGGASRLGLARGGSEADAIAVVHRALDLGINYIDTAANYRNEAVIGKALKGHRGEVIVSSKVAPVGQDGELITRRQLRTALDASLSKLGVEMLDVYHLHRPERETYDYCIDELMPELLELRKEGKVRFLALSESSGDEHTHSMLLRASEDDYWDVMMTGFNFFNQSDRYGLFPKTISKNIAIEIMGAARNPFSQVEEFAKDVRRLAESGDVDVGLVDLEDPLGFLADAGIGALSEAAYRFTAYEPGVHVVLVGTGSISHLEENVRAVENGPLPDEVRQRFISLFGHLSLVLKRYSNPR